MEGDGIFWTIKLTIFRGLGSLGIGNFGLPVVMDSVWGPVDWDLLLA